MKKILLLLIPAFILAFIVLNPSPSDVIYILNWGEYINPDLIPRFEEEHNCTVKMDVVGSSEDMYQKLKTRTTQYDIAIPGDYMIERMYQENMLIELDYSKIPNYSKDMFNPDLIKARKNSTFVEGDKYAVPYFWGAYTILYSTRKPYLKEVIEENGFDVFFDRSLFGEYASSTRIGMYDVPRFLTTIYLAKNGKDINSVNKDDLDGFVDAVADTKYDQWGNDQLKKNIASGNLDVCLIQLGDFFDQRYQTGTVEELEIQFSAYIPSNSVAFYDGMVIPTTAGNVDLAYSFINFMLDPDNAYDNVDYVGYTPPINEVIERLRESEDYVDLIEEYPFFLDPLQGNETTLFSNIKYFSDGSKYAIYLRDMVNKAKAKS